LRANWSMYYCTVVVWMCNQWYKYPGCMYVCIYVWMYVFIYFCMYLFSYVAMYVCRKCYINKINYVLSMIGAEKNRILV
jgi:hypothetical protein